jgi:hypothetical protein
MKASALTLLGEIIHADSGELYEIGKYNSFALKGQLINHG